MVQAWLRITDTKAPYAQATVLVRRDESAPGAYDYPMTAQTWREEFAMERTIGWEGEGNWNISVEVEGVRFWEGGYTNPSFTLQGGGLTSFVNLPFREGQKGTGFHSAYGARIGPNAITWECTSSTGAREQN